MATESIALTVPLVGQQNAFDGRPLMQPSPAGVLHRHGGMACWYASACMVALFFRAGPRLGLPYGWQFGPRIADKGDR
jgi:hypothetical protein